MSHLTEPITERDHVKGNLSAKVTLVEYGDYECPHCGRAHPIVQRILKTMGDQIQFVFRNFPLSEIHPQALHAATSAEYAATQGKFWEMHDAIFEHQSALSDQKLAAYGANLGLNPGEVLANLDNDAALAIVQHDFSTGVRSGVNGTPAFFINGVRHDESWEYRSLVAALQDAAG